ncbi:histidine kinase [Echinicola shivajiensis]|uniref:histidine kinase n=1 Tax=Echinicola shivajiensis TaxID=1035916 RepID=UPI001BFC5B29|nr:sensor histidine kinase [Echinicola shivajiensis]
MTYTNSLFNHIFLKNIKWHFLAWTLYILLDFISSVIFGMATFQWTYIFLNLAYILFIFYSIPLILWLSFYTEKKKTWTACTIISALLLLSSIKILMTNSLTAVEYNWGQLLIAEFWRLLYFGLLSSGFWFIIFSVLMKNQKLEAQNETLKAKLDLAKGQLSPHFLFNSLNAFRAELFYQSRDLSDWMVELSDLVKYGVLSTESNLAEELSMIENYINLEQRRHQNECAIKLSKNIDLSLAKKLVIPRMVLLTLVENIFKHGELTDHFQPARLAFSLRKNRTSPHSLTFTMLIENKVGPYHHHSLGSGIDRIKEILEFHFPSKFELISHKTSSDFELYLALNYDHTEH